MVDDVLIWQANWQAISEGGIAGSGAGTHRDIYPVYFSHSWPTVFTHAENGYLQMATEMGLPGVLLLLSTFGVALVWAVRAWRRCELREEIACLGAILAALAVSAAHSVVDFVWYIPATMTLVVLLLAALCRLANLKSPQASSSTETIPSGRWELSLTLAGASVVMLVLLSGPALASRAWDRYYTQSARHEIVSTRFLQGAGGNWRSELPSSRIDLLASQGRSLAASPSLRSSLGRRASAIGTRLPTSVRRT